MECCVQCGHLWRKENLYPVEINRREMFYGDSSTMGYIKWDLGKGEGGAFAETHWSLTCFSASSAANALHLPVALKQAGCWMQWCCAALFFSVQWERNTSKQLLLVSLVRGSRSWACSVPTVSRAALNIQLGRVNWSQSLWHQRFFLFPFWSSILLMIKHRLSQLRDSRAAESEII